MHTLDISSIRHVLIDEKRHSSHEGASVRKRNGLYYLVFSDITRGRSTCLGYAVSKSPLGPFEYKGIIIDNIGCDPETWNNHGSITEFKGQCMYSTTVLPSAADTAVAFASSPFTSKQTEAFLKSYPPPKAQNLRCVPV